MSGLNCRGSIVGGSIVRGSIVRGSIVGGSIVRGSIVRGPIVRDSIVGGSIVGGSIVGGSIVRGPIVGGLIVGGSIVRGSLVGYNHIRDEHAKMMSGAECNLIYNSDNREQANTTGVAYDLLHNTCSGKQQYSICLIVFSRLSSPCCCQLHCVTTICYSINTILPIYAVCDREGNSGRNRNRNRIAIIWPEPDQHPTKLAGFGRILNRI